VKRNTNQVPLEGKRQDRNPDNLFLLACIAKGYINSTVSGTSIVRRCFILSILKVLLRTKCCSYGRTLEHTFRTSLPIGNWQLLL
jgi:hypothetical protein